MDYTFSASFTLRKGYLFCEEVKVRDLQTSLQQSLVQCSPFYLYSKYQIKANVAAYKNALNDHEIPHILGYSVKANHNPKVLALMKEYGCTAVAVSGNEIQLAMQVGMQPQNIVFNGNGKQLWEVELAVQNGCLLNLDSGYDLDRVIQAATRTQKAARILLRLNPDIDPKVHPYVATGLSASKFGIEECQLGPILQRIKGESMVELVGLHCHLGSTIDTVEVFRECLEVMLELVDRVRTEGFTSLQYINLGGGLGIDQTKHAYRTRKPHLSGDRNEEPNCNPTEQDNADSMMPTPEDLIASVSSRIQQSGLTLILEPGRSLVGSACVLVTAVLGNKHNGSERYIVVDGAMTEVIRPCLYGAYHHIELAEPSQHPSSSTQVLAHVVGPVCESADFLGKNRWLPLPHEGCGLVVFDAGAYCGSMGSNYNMRVRPAEVLVDGNKWTLIRRPDTLDDILKPYADLKQEL